MMSFKVMIADDEPIIKDGLLSFIDWEALNCDVVSMVDNGIQAKEELATHPIDILLADIRMPGLNGIELAEHVHRFHPQTKVIILTAYPHFNYAQSAIKYNVFEFIVKTNPIEKLLAAIKRAISVITQEREEMNKVKHLESKIDENIPAIRNKFLADVMHGLMASDKDILNKAQDLHVILTEYYVLLFGANTITYGEKQIEFNEYSEIMRSIHRLFMQKFKHLNPYFLFLGYEKICVILPFTPHQQFSHINELINYCHDVLSLSTLPQDITIHIGVSERHESLIDLPIAYQQALRSLVNKNIEKTLQFQNQGHHHIVINKIIQYIEQHFHEKITLDTLATYVHMNSSYLSRLFNKEIGESLTDYINRIRIERAKQLIVDSDLNINEITYMVGFSDPSYFSNTFKKFTGVTPREYKQHA